MKPPSREDRKAVRAKIDALIDFYDQSGRNPSKQIQVAADAEGLADALDLDVFDLPRVAAQVEYRGRTLIATEPAD